MPRNVGTLDRTLRLLVGLGLFSLVFILEGGLRWIGLVGLILLLTALTSRCPAYSLLGLSTCPLTRGQGGRDAG